MRFYLYVHHSLFITLFEFWWVGFIAHHSGLFSALSPEFIGHHSSLIIFFKHVHDQPGQWFGEKVG